VRALFSPTRAEQVAQLQAAMTSVLNKYVESFYRKRQQRWDSSKMVHAPLKKDDENFQNYVVRVPRSDKDLLKNIHEAIEEWKKFQKLLRSDLPNIHFDRHLYQPLLITMTSGRSMERGGTGRNMQRRIFFSGMKMVKVILNPSSRDSPTSCRSFASSQI